MMGLFYMRVYEIRKYAKGITDQPYFLRRSVVQYKDLVFVGRRVRSYNQQ